MLALGSAPLAIQFIAYVLERTGEFALIYWMLGTAGCLALIGILLLPPVTRRALPPVAANPAPAE